jgi:hypothetical protein
LGLSLLETFVGTVIINNSLKTIEERIFAGLRGTYAADAAAWAALSAAAFASAFDIPGSALQNKYKIY